MSTDREEQKQRVRAHWELETCGTRYGTASDRAEYYRQIRETRASLEPWILPFQDAGRWSGRRVLEIGVGAGSDFLAWLRAGAIATGVDLTDAAISRTREHIEAAGLDPAACTLRSADAERLPFADASFDLVYSYGVLHHTPDPPAAFREARRVLAPDGELRVMLYHRPSWTAWMLWTVHCLARLRPFSTPRRAVYEHLESPGTMSYSVREARALLLDAGFRDVRATLHLGPGDLLLIEPSDRYRSHVFRLLRALYPRPLVRALGARFGLIMLLEAKPA